jgi:hypothetical protein
MRKKRRLVTQRNAKNNRKTILKRSTIASLDYEDLSGREYRESLRV